LSIANESNIGFAGARLPTHQAGNGVSHKLRALSWFT